MSVVSDINSGCIKLKEKLKAAVGADLTFIYCTEAINSVYDILLQFTNMYTDKSKAHEASQLSCLYLVLLFSHEKDTRAVDTVYLADIHL